MCGIVGIIKLNQKSEIRNQKEDIKRMTDTLEHRGPDDEGIFVEQNIALGHRRLSILDISKAGHQPMFYGDLVIVYNGEIYNYLEIRAELIQKGHKFSSQSDTEVILASYKEWGEKCLAKFNGMWALVIYDRKKKTLFGARDRMGVKPFYYYINQDRFIFASEIKAILAHPEVKSKPNDKIVWDFLICSTVDHSTETFFEGVSELRGGHYFILKNKKLHIERYWDLDHKKTTHFPLDQDYQEQFRQLFLDSVRLRLRSDVPIGTCLSGGLDSSAIVGTVNYFLQQAGKIKQIGKWQKTFSACYDPKKYPNCDERRYIKEVIKKTQAHSYDVFPSAQKLTQEIKELIWHQDYPFLSTSIYAQWNVFRLASENKVKVILDGQGADELLAGYHHFFGVYFVELLRELNFWRFSQEAHAYSKNHQQSVFSIFRHLFMILASRGIAGNILSHFAKNRWAEYDLFLPAWRKKYRNPSLLMPTKNIFKNSLYYNFKIGLPSLLRYEDRNSMAFSIESRVPFLDYRLVEFLYSLPDDQKIRHGATKYIMRQALKGILPEKIRKRQDKIGFATPEEIWMKQNFHQEFKKIFRSDRFFARGYFQKNKAEKIFDEFFAGKIKNYALFWRLYCLEIWFQTFID